MFALAAVPAFPQPSLVDVGTVPAGKVRITIVVGAALPVKNPAETRVPVKGAWIVVPLLDVAVAPVQLDGQVFEPNALLP